MKKFFFVLSFIFAFSPFISNAQTWEVTGASWNNSQMTDTTITLNGVLLGNITSPTIFAQLEYGIARLNVDGVPEPNYFLPFYYYPPAGSAMQNLTGNTPTSYNFQWALTGLKPSTRYYFDLLEWDGPNGPNSNNPTGDIHYVATLPPTNPQISFTATSSTGALVEGKFFTSGGTALSGFPLKLYLLSDQTDDSSVMGTPVSLITDTFNPIDGTGYFSANYTGLTPETTYYLKIENEASGLNMLVPYMPVTTPAASADPDPNNGSGGIVINTNSGGLFGGGTNGIVACGGAADCNFNTLIQTINNVVNFLIFIVGFPIAAIIFAWAGITMITSGGNTSKRDKAKEMAFDVIVGLILALLSWVIIWTILKVFGYSGPLIGLFGI